MAHKIKEALLPHGKGCIIPILKYFYVKNIDAR